MCYYYTPLLCSEKQFEKTDIQIQSKGPSAEQDNVFRQGRKRKLVAKIIYFPFSFHQYSFFVFT